MDTYPDSVKCTQCELTKIGWQSASPQSVEPFLLCAIVCSADSTADGQRGVNGTVGLSGVRLGVAIGFLHLRWGQYGTGRGGLWSAGEQPGSPPPHIGGRARLYRQGNFQGRGVSSQLALKSTSPSLANLSNDFGQRTSFLNDFFRGL